MLTSLEYSSAWLWWGVIYGQGAALKLDQPKVAYGDDEWHMQEYAGLIHSALVEIWDA